ncbi:MAG TPA: hypothetical protein VFT58_02115 [Nitrososphaera sp.]|nr:hypothetical protein [Nitrososphaera sp.]
MSEEAKKPDTGSKPEQKPADAGAMEAKTDAASTVTSIEAKPTKGLLRVKIYTPFKTFYEGDARSISALNETGTFDVLPGHHNFITMLLPCDVKVEAPDKKIKTIPIARGLMHVRDDKLIIFLDV